MNFRPSRLAAAVSLALASGAALAVTPVFINEIHYDNAGTDTGERIEIAGPAGTSLAGWQLVRYNGSNGQSYSTPAQTSTIPAAIPGTPGSTGFVTVSYAQDGLQNGAPDGVALVDGGNVVVQFLSYEGTFTAANGPAAGLTSVSLGVGIEESSGTPAGHSLQLTGTGSSYEDFTWASPAAETFGAVNNAQTFVATGTETAPAVTGVDPADGTTGVAADTDITVAFSEAVTAADGAFGLECTAGGAVPLAVAGGPVSFTLTPQFSLAEGETCTLTVVAALVSDQDASDPPDTLAADFTSAFTTAAPPPIARIHDIQGSGSSVTGAGPFTVEAIVVGTFQEQASGDLRGFFIQEEDADADSDPATSEGLFVYCNTCPLAVAVGDRVQVTGSASEFFDMSQLTATTVDSVQLLAAGQPLPAPAAVTLPIPNVPAGDLTAAQAAINAYLEQFEGMLVQFAGELAVAEYFELARYGQLVLAAGGRPRQFTDVSLPGAAGYVDHQIDVAARTIILDDENNLQNDAVTTVDKPYFWPRPGLGLDNYIRGGDTISGLTGVLHWSWAGQSGTDAWRIRPVEPAFTYAFTPVNQAPATPPAVGGGLRVASFNVLNYFLTIDTTSSTSSGTCGPDLVADCRGADSAAELARQQEKLTAALLGLDADVIGLIEMENTPGVEPLAAIVADLQAAGGGTYAYVDTGVIGTDAIRVGLIYRPAAVAAVGAHAVLDSSVDPDFDSSRSRPALAQTFEDLASGTRFTVAVNHLKSKGDSGLGGTNGICTVQGPGADVNCDQGDGQGFWNDSRTKAAQALADWLAGDPTGSGTSNVLIVGDLNAYRYEDPVTALRNAGYVDLIDTLRGPAAYGYLFSGQLGYLDHALASPALASQVAGIAEWHINADEIPLFDYNDDIRDTGESSFERKSTVNPLYAADPFRTSDHDPVIVGLQFDLPPVTGDFDGDRDVDRDDVRTVIQNRGPASPGDPMDMNGDGRINVLDARLVALACTRPFCATE